MKFLILWYRYFGILAIRRLEAARYEVGDGDHRRSLDEVREALTKLGIQGLAVSEVKGFGRQKRARPRSIAAPNTP